MLIPIHGVTHCTHCYTWSKALCSLLYMELSLMLNVIHELKLYAHCHTWSEALCPLLYMELMHME